MIRILIFLILMTSACWADCPFMEHEPYKFNNMICMQSCTVDGKRYCFEAEEPKEDYSQEIKDLQTHVAILAAAVNKLQHDDSYVNSVVKGSLKK